MKGIVQFFKGIIPNIDKTICVNLKKANQTVIVIGTEVSEVYLNTSINNLPTVIVNGKGDPVNC